jgi:hypothetical protein
LNSALEDPAEALGSPALADSRQRRVVRQDLVQAVAREPADGDVDLRLAQQPAIVDDAEQEASQHQPQRHLRVDARPTVVGTVDLSNLLPQPGQVEDPVDAGQHVIVRNQLPERADDEQLWLPTLLATQHLVVPSPLATTAGGKNHVRTGFSTAPRGSAARWRPRPWRRRPSDPRGHPRSPA